MTAVPQVNECRATNTEIWLLLEACWLMISASSLLWRSLSDLGLAFCCASGRAGESGWLEGPGSPPPPRCSGVSYQQAQGRPRAEEETRLEKLMGRQFYLVFSLNRGLWQISRDQLSLQLPILHLTYAERKNLVPKPGSQAHSPSSDFS